MPEFLYGIKKTEYISQFRMSKIKKLRGMYMRYRDYDIVNKWWVRKLTIEVGGNEIEFDSLEEAKSYIDDLYEEG